MMGEHYPHLMMHRNPGMTKSEKTEVRQGCMAIAFVAICAMIPICYIIWTVSVWL